MPNLLPQDVDEALVIAVKEHAGARGVNAEAEHRDILEAALPHPKKHSFVESLMAIPDVGTNADFERLDE